MYLALIMLVAATLMAGFAFFLGPDNRQTGLMGAKTVAEQMMLIQQQALRHVAAQPSIDSWTSGQQIPLTSLAAPTGATSVPGWTTGNLEAYFESRYYIFNNARIVVTYAEQDATPNDAVPLAVGVEPGAVARELRIVTRYDPGAGITGQAATVSGAPRTVLFTQQQISSVPSNVDPARGANPISYAPTSITVPLPDGIPAGVPILVTYLRR